MPQRRSYAYLINKANQPASPTATSAEADCMELARHVLPSADIPDKTVLVGHEAFADWRVLPGLLADFASAGLTPMLLTKGTVPAPEDVVSQALLDLVPHGPFKIFVVADNDTVNEPALTLFDQFLRSVRRTLLITPEILLLSRSKDDFATAIFRSDEINQTSIIYPRCATDLADYLGRATVDVRNMRCGRPASTRTPVSTAPATTLLHFNSLVIETTHFCNARCSHCYTSCGPDSPKTRLKPGDLLPVLKDAATIGSLGRKCHVGGGESTIYWRELVEILNAAKDLGFENSIVTNGFWGKSPREACRKAAELRHAGVTKIEFSVDAMHQEYVSSSVMSNVIRGCKENEISVVLRICATKSRTADKTIALLDPEDCLGVTIGVSKTTPVGRASTAIDRDDLWLYPGIPLGACYRLLNLTIAPDGGVYPCCAGSELCPSLSMGNIFLQDLSEIVRLSRSNILLRTLVHAGPAYFAALLKEAGLGDRFLPGYSSFCHLCNDICSDSDLVEVVAAALRARVRDQLLALVPGQPGVDSLPG